MKNKAQLHELLERKWQQYESLEFIANDPILIPHQFSKREDIEISGFLTAIIAWGNRKSILNSANRMLDLMDQSPFDFIVNHQDSDLKRCEGFVHRTFNADDLTYFLSRLQQLYKKYQSMEKMFLGSNSFHAETSISNFKTLFFEAEHLPRTRKHLADPFKKSSAKRINMFLRWMVRSDEKGVDFGLWKTISKNQLMLPLDVHTASVSRKLGLLKRKQNDWQAVEEVTTSLKKIDPEDPVKYDFALFGMGESGEL